MPILSAQQSWSFTSTGEGAAFDAKGYTLEGRFYVEAITTSTLSYQLRTARTSTGPWAVISSGTLSSGACGIGGVTGPVRYLSPRIKTLAGSGSAGSTGVTVEFFAV